MKELLTKYVLAMITASIAFIEPTFNFLYAIVAVITIDCVSAYNLNRRVKMNTHISDTLSEGWDKKNSIDWTNY